MLDLPNFVANGRKIVGIAANYNIPVLLDYNDMDNLAKFEGGMRIDSFQELLKILAIPLKYQENFFDNYIDYRFSREVARDLFKKLWCILCSRPVEQLESHLLPESLLKVLSRPTPNSPGIFLKPTTAYITKGQPIIVSASILRLKIPKGFTVNEEIELGVIIGKTGKAIPEDRAMEYVGGYCVALDMTATDQMQEARSTGQSWTLGKGFDTACPVSEFIPKEKIPDPHNIELWCSVNGEMKQQGNTNDLVFNIKKLINFISQYMTLEPCDLIITGSPPGMGPVNSGDVIEGGIKNVVSLKYTVE